MQHLVDKAEKFGVAFIDIQTGNLLWCEETGRLIERVTLDEPERALEGGQSELRLSRSYCGCIDPLSF